MRSAIAASWALVCFGFFSTTAFCAPGAPPRATDADIIVTAAPEYVPVAALSGGERFPQGARLLLIHAGKAQPLIAQFWASADANVSFDGQRVLFAGKPAAGDAWQIWEMSLPDGSLRKLISSHGDAIRPLYLPGGRLVYAQHIAQGFQLQAAGLDGNSLFAPIDAQAGAAVTPLSYMPGSAIPSDVMLDGRIVFESGFPLGTGTAPEIFLVYSDGSGVESYRCDHGQPRWGAKQLASGDVVFTHGAALARFTSPLAHEASIQAPRADYAGSPAETASGAWLLSARPRQGMAYALTQWTPAGASTPAGTALQTVLAIDGMNLVEPVVVAQRARPRRHPSGLHPWDYANLMALDSRMSRQGDLKEAAAQVRMETIDAQGRTVIAGVAPVESDGSFYVKTPADKPIRFALLDRNGAVVREEHGWFWIRRGEQRYCVGCHTGPERSPENRVPEVLRHTTIPVDLSGATSLSAQAAQTQRGN